jgi:hypothetical protein
VWHASDPDTLKKLRVKYIVNGLCLPALCLLFLSFLNLSFFLSATPHPNFYCKDKPTSPPPIPSSSSSSSSSSASSSGPSPECVYLQVPVEDVSDSDLFSHFDAVFKFLEGARHEAEGVLMKDYREKEEENKLKKASASASSSLAQPQPETKDKEKDKEKEKEKEKEKQLASPSSSRCLNVPLTDLNTKASPSVSRRSLPSSDSSSLVASSSLASPLTLVPAPCHPSAPGSSRSLDLITPLPNTSPFSPTVVSSPQTQYRSPQSKYDSLLLPPLSADNPESPFYIPDLTATASDLPPFRVRSLFFLFSFLSSRFFSPFLLYLLCFFFFPSLVPVLSSCPCFPFSLFRFWFTVRWVSLVPLLSFSLT